MLVPILPPSEFQVQVSAELDWTALQRTSEQFDPNAQAILREESSEVPPGAVGPGSPAYNSAESESRYSRTVESITNSPGSIARLSVAVFVNERAPLFGGGPDTPPNPALLAQQTSRIEAIVRSAVALDPVRGDQIVVNASPFWSGEQVDVVSTEAAPRLDILNLVERFIRPAIGLLGIAVVLLVGLKAVKVQAGRPRALGSGGRSRSQPALGPASGAQEFDEPNVRSPLVDASLRLQKQVAREAEGNPDTTARVIQAWLSEPAT
jgi:flagellar M-ring protein FliF